MKTNVPNWTGDEEDIFLAKAQRIDVDPDRDFTQREALRFREILFEALEEMAKDDPSIKVKHGQ